MKHAAFLFALCLSPVLAQESHKLQIYQAPHALNAEATCDRIAFLAEQLSFTAPDPKAVAAIPVLFQPPWPKH